MSNEINQEVEDLDNDELEEPGEEQVVDGVDLDIDEAPIDDFAAAEVEVEEEEEAPARSRKVAEEDEEDDDEDPDDVEADLEAILRDRMAAADDDDDDDEAEAAAAAVKTAASAAPRNDEFVCESCFMLVNRGQFGSSKDPRCPMGDTECPSITKIFG